MTRKERFEFVIRYFLEHNPNPVTELKYYNPYELIVAVILSAQCTDKRVNITTPAIYLQYPTVQHLAQATFDELFPYIKSISYPNNKNKAPHRYGAKSGDCFWRRHTHDGGRTCYPAGRGRKTANVVTSVIDSQPNMAVDTHSVPGIGKNRVIGQCKNAAGNGVATDNVYS